MVEDGSQKIEIKAQGRITSVLFTEDGQQVLGGGDEGILRRWQVNDGHEVGEVIQTDRAAVQVSTALSPDRKWLVCALGTRVHTAHIRVWNVETLEKALDIPVHRCTPCTVHISADSTKFATGGPGDREASIWSMTTGHRLVGPMKHDSPLVAVRFSPSGDRLATADAESIRIFSSSNGQLLSDIPCVFRRWPASPLAWSDDGQRLFAASSSGAKCFSAASRAPLATWPIPGDTSHFAPSILVSRNQRFIALLANRSLSFWDASTYKPIGDVVGYEKSVLSIALCPNDDYVATGEENKIILRSLRSIIPKSYFPVDLPLTSISDAAFCSWKQGNLTRVEQLLSEEIQLSSELCDRTRTFALRAIVRARLQKQSDALEDAQNSIDTQRSVIGHIAHAMAHVCGDDYDSAMDAFDLVFTDGLAAENCNNFLLLIKAILLYTCEKQDNAVSRVNNLIRVVADKSLYVTVWSQMHLFLGRDSLEMGNHKRALELFQRAREGIPLQRSPYLEIISLIFGWDLDGLPVAIQQHLQKCVRPFEEAGDAEMHANNSEAAIKQYSIALSLNSSNPAGLYIKRSRAQGLMNLWEEALNDADDAIKADSRNPWTYERRHVALHALERFNEAMGAYTQMHSLLHKSDGHDTRQLGEQYVSPIQLETAIENAVRGVFKICPHVLIDVNTGCLCNDRERLHTFKSDPQCKELMSSMTLKLDDERIVQVVEKYFQYVTFSHVWEGEEPLFHYVKSARSVWNLDLSPLNNKLRKFCEVVREDGYRWAWSDTCCIDKTISTVLILSLKMMYKWYEASAATFALLASIDSPSSIGDLTDSAWMTRAWTAQELLVPKVIRFYDRNWKPYLGDTRRNHKESPEIMQELANAIGISRTTITTFNPDDLSIRAKLRLASTRNAGVEEDVAYSLIGIFKSDIRPQYGEGYAALGHLLEEIVARSGDVSVLAWTGKSSQYNSCLPSTLHVYRDILPPVNDAGMDARVAALTNSLSQEHAIHIHDKITSLPVARFANRRLYLPSIVFVVKKLEVLGPVGSGPETRYQAVVVGIGPVKFQTSDKLSSKEPRRLVLVHPWIRDLRDPYGDATWADETEGVDEVARLAAHRARAVRLVVRLNRPFEALLLQQQAQGEYRRVAAEHAITVAGLDPQIDYVKDVQAKVMDIL